MKDVFINVALKLLQQIENNQVSITYITKSNDD